MKKTFTEFFDHQMFCISFSSKYFEIHSSFDFDRVKNAQDFVVVLKSFQGTGQVLSCSVSLNFIKKFLPQHSCQVFDGQSEWSA